MVCGYRFTDQHVLPCRKALTISPDFVTHFVTFCDLVTKKESHLALFLGFHGGPAGVRTLDLGIKSPLLYQLSYRSVLCHGTKKNGVGEGARTLDLRSHSPSLCQLSYTHRLPPRGALNIVQRAPPGCKTQFWTGCLQVSQRGRRTMQGALALGFTWLRPKCCPKRRRLPKEPAGQPPIP